MQERTVVFAETLITSLNFGIILMGTLFAFIMLLRYRQKESLAYFLLSLSSLAFVAARILTIYSIIVFDSVRTACFLSLVQEYLVVSFFFTMPYYLLKTFEQTRNDYVILSVVMKAGAVIAILHIVLVILLPHLFLDFSATLSARTYEEFMHIRPAAGPLYHFRDIYLGALTAIAITFVTRKILLHQTHNDSFFLAVGGLCALYFAVISLIKRHIELPAFILLGRNHDSQFIIGLGLFYITSLITSILRATNKAIESHKLTRALQNSEQELMRLAYHDPHTGILNRKSFYSQLEASIEIAKRHPTMEKRAVMLMDLDHFKEINDSYGHPVGDELIRQMVRRFQSKIRKSDLLFRLVGDEFALIVYNVASIENIALMAQKLLLCLRNHFSVFDNNIYLSTTIGISIFPDDGEDSDTILRHADYALYEAKKDRNTFKFYTTEMQRKAFERMSIINALRTSIRNREFELYYQGLHRNSGQLAGAEALIRWTNPGWNHVATEFFIRLAENSGLIIELGKWIIEKAFSQWDNFASFDTRFFISINLSVKQLRDANLLEIIESLETMYRIDPHSIMFEITESTFLENAEKMGMKLKALTSRGYRLSIDDFGTGFSSFYYLKTMPVSSLKIDRSFLEDVGNNPVNRAMVTSMINMGHGMDMSITAEGVETEEQKTFLIREGCDFLQGFFLDKPQPINSFLANFNLDS